MSDVLFETINRRLRQVISHSPQTKINTGRIEISFNHCFCRTADNIF